MGAPKKYDSAEKLRKDVEKYFKSITRTITMTEKKSTGVKDKDGHWIYEDVPIKNALGKEVAVTQYIIPPSVFDLCRFLKISESTWENYCNPDKHPEFLGTTTYVWGRMRAWNLEQLLTRQGKDLKGIIFNLENNYGYSEKHSLEHSGGIEQYLRQLEQEGEGGQQF